MATKKRIRAEVTAKKEILPALRHADEALSDGAKPAQKTAVGAAPHGAAMPIPGRPSFTRPPPSAMVYALGDSWIKYPTIFDQGAPIHLIRALDSASQPHGDHYFFVERGVAGATSYNLTAAVV